MERARASIIVSSYNYERFLAEAIDSALNQTYPETEVIVVDDGSSDGSREIIAGYGTRIIPLLKENGGQASAFNAGFAVSRGEVIVFLDSDDALLPTAVERAMALFDRPDVVKVHWPLRIVDEHGAGTGALKPPRRLAAGDLREMVRHTAPVTYVWPPTSGNAWARRFLARIFPLPEAAFRTSPDLYLSALAPLFGPMQRVDEPQAIWRAHGANSSGSEPLEGRLNRAVQRVDHCFTAARQYCAELGIEARPASWISTSWWHQARQAVQEILAVVPPGESFILVDEDQWATDAVIAGRRRIPFPERDTRYAGQPASDAAAIQEFERLRQAGARTLVIGSPAFWWLDFYTGLHHHLRSQFPCRLANEHLIVFDLRPSAGDAERQPECPA